MREKEFVESPNTVKEVSRTGRTDNNEKNGVSPEALPSISSNVSKVAQDKVFMGEDVIRDQKEIIITQRATEWASAVDKGFSAISPVTEQFMDLDFENLAELTTDAESVYIILPNETNELGHAQKIAEYLEKEGKNVFLVEIPKAGNKTEMDLNKYFLEHTADDFREVLNESKSLLDFLIDGLPEDFIKAQGMIQEEIAPLLLELDKAALEHYLGVIRKKTKTHKKALDLEIEAAREKKNESLVMVEEKEIDPEVQKQADSISLDPLLFRKRIDAVNEMGVANERGVIAMSFCTLDSRLLPQNSANPNALAIKIAGHSGSGKSYVVNTCLDVYPESCYHLITNGSAKSLYYLQGGLKHKALIVTEAFPFQKGKAVDSELVYSIRTLLSEGTVRYLLTVKIKGGNVAKENILEGPTAFLTTTIMESLEPQMEDRLFTVHSDESPVQTRAVGRMIAQQKAGIFEGLDPKTIDSWKLFHESLKPVDVVVPFAPSIMDFIEQTPNPPIAARRAANRMLTMIQTVACAYQHQRKRDSKGRIIAEIPDYSMSRQIVQEAFRENMGAQEKKTEKYLEVIKEKEKITPGNLAKMFGVSGAAISGWVGKRIKAGMIEWCDEKGISFLDDKNLETAKRRGTAYLKVSGSYRNEVVKGLPTPYDLTGDSRWNEGGDLLKMYDLELGGQTAAFSVFTYEKEFTPVQELDKKDEIHKIIEYSGDQPESVRVLTRPEGEISNDEELTQVPGNGHGNGKEMEDLDELTKKLAEEFSFWNIKNLSKMTPHVCRKGCKHYDSIGDPAGGDFREFCEKSKRTLVRRDNVCENFEGNRLSETVLTF